MNQQDQIVVSKLKKIAIISLIFMSIQILGGALAHSIAIMADAFHLLSDVIAYVISLYAVLLSKKIAPKYLTFGYEKAQPLGALINVAIIWCVTVQLFIQATHRIIERQVVQQPLFMLITSIFGLGCNLFIMKTLHSEQGHGHSHGHDHGHHHGHLHEQHDHHDHHKHKKSHGDELKNKSLLNGYVEPVCSCNSQVQVSAVSRQVSNASKKSSNTSDSKDFDSPLQLGHDLVPRNIQHKGYCSLHSTQKSHNHHDHDHSEKKQKKRFENINMQAAYIHILSDIILSVGVIVSASVIYFVCGEDKQWSAWQLADPFCTYLFSVVALYSTISIIKQSIRYLLDGCQNPQLINKLQYILRSIQEKSSNIEFGDLKLWSSNRGKHYCALKIKVKSHSKISELSESTLHSQKQHEQIQAAYDKIKHFCQKQSITSFIETEQEHHHH